jgi:hypothetical protein
MTSSVMLDGSRLRRPPVQAASHLLVMVDFSRREK